MIVEMSPRSEMTPLDHVRKAVELLAYECPKMARSRSRESRCELPVSGVQRTWSKTRSIAAVDPGCSLTRGLDVKLSVMCLPGSLFSPQ
jgi:hypothetical protein